jgi:hypothetical protein
MPAIFDRDSHAIIDEVQHFAALGHRHLARRE